MKGLGSAEARQARFLRRQALVLSEALLGATDSALAQAEQDVAAGSLSPLQPTAQDLAAVMEVDGQPAGAPSGQAQQEQQQHGVQVAPPAPAGGAAELQSSPAPAGPAGPTQQQQPAAQTPGGAAAGAAAHSTTPGTDLREVLGSPALLPSAEQQLLQERCMALLQVAHSFQRDLSRWLQVRQQACWAVAYNYGPVEMLGCARHHVAATCHQALKVQNLFPLSRSETDGGGGCWQQQRRGP